MRAVFVQSYLKYDKNEFRAAQYHGAIFAEEFCRQGHQAWKMIDGNPDQDIPKSHILLVSSLEQRISPKYWEKQKFDLVVVYGGHDISLLPMYKAIKKGLPNCKLILKTDASNGVFAETLENAFKLLKISYIKARGGSAKFLFWNGKDGESPLPIFVAVAYALKNSIKLFFKQKKQMQKLFEEPDYISYENKYAKKETEEWMLFHGNNNLIDKLIWLGYPVRDSFAANSFDVQRKEMSVISIANWKHAKDIKLHVKTTALLLGLNSEVTFTIIGKNSKVLYEKIKRLQPSKINRVTQINEIMNEELGCFLQKSQVFMQCSISEGICSTPIEAMASGCSCALSVGLGVPCFSEFVQNDCGTQAKSRKPKDMADAVLVELAKWRNGERNPDSIKKEWDRTLVSHGVKILMNLYEKK